MEAAAIEGLRQRAIAIEDWEELDSWDEAMDELEARMKVKEEENIGAKVKVVTEFRVAQVEKIDVMQGGGARDPGDGDREIGAKEVEEPRIDKVEVEVAASKVELECGAARDDVLQGGGAIDPGEGDQSDANDELECGAAKDDFWQGGGAREPGEGDREIGVKVVREVCAKKVELGFAAKDVLKEFCIPKSNYEVEFASRSKVFSSGGLDPGEDAANSVDEKQVDVEDVLGFCAAEDDPEFGATKDEIQYCDAKDAEFELQRFANERLRFVTAGCRALGTNSEYG